MPIKLTGMESLLKTINNLRNIPDPVVEEALKEAAEVFKKIVEEKAPRSPYNKGHLFENIIISEVVNGRIRVAPEARHYFYAKFLEFGTVDQPAQPFMEPAFIEGLEEAQKAMAKVIRRWVARQ